MQGRNTIAAGMLALALALAACGGEEPAQDQAPSAPEGAPATQGGQAAQAPAAQEAPEQANAAGHADTAHALLDKAGKPIPLVDFDPASVPLSDAALGELPFVSMPDGYAVASHSVRPFARFPVRMGDGLHWVEGTVWDGRLVVERSRRRDKEFSELELRRNLEAVLDQAGARRVFEGPLQRQLYFGQLQEEIGQGFHDGVNLEAKIPTSVYVIRQADRTAWVQLSIGQRQAAMVVVEERPFEQTARWGDAFPWLSPPAGYGGGTRTRDFDMYPFWTGSGFEEVEGKVWVARVNGKRGAHSMYELRRNLEAVMQDAGGTLVFDGRIPKEDAQRYTADFKRPFLDGTTRWFGYDSLVYRVDRPDGRQVWVHARLESNSAGWVVVEREGFVQTAALLPADALKRRLDADGRVAIEVNFAVDKADILPESGPQLEQVHALLQADPALRLSVEGHTDDTGSAERNRSLSQARAASVVAALSERGIDPGRLSAEGFGAERPVADNASEQGRARNRRVELVRR